MKYLMLAIRTLLVASILGGMWFYGYVIGRGDAPKPLVIYLGGNP